MKKTLITTAALLFSTSVSAGPAYTYFDARYVDVSPLDGFSLEYSSTVRSNGFSRSYGEFTSFGPLKNRLLGLELGAMGQLRPSTTLDVTLGLAYSELRLANSTSDQEFGLAASLGLRSKLVSRFEFELRPQYLGVHERDFDLRLGLLAAPLSGVAFGVSYDVDAERLRAGVRLGF